MQASGAFRFARDMGKGGGAVAVLAAIKRRTARVQGSGTSGPGVTKR